jgi:hypothetical protein
MPATYLGRRDASRFEIVGQHGKGMFSVKHAAILAEPTSLERGTNAEVFDMAVSILRLSLPNPVPVHVVGWLPLSTDEEFGLEVWLEDMCTRAHACEYIAYPAEEPIADPVTHTTTAWRFSCAGFVSRAYSEGAGIKLVVSESNLPLLDFSTIRLIWLPGATEQVARKRLGPFLRGPEPWPVLVPGYLLHALARSRAELPYRPWAFELFFPIPTMMD